MLPDGSPYPGLRPFEASETHLFFGREEQVDALLARLHRSRLVAAVGESGAGKSSLVRAGLLPAHEAGFLANAGADWRILLMRPGAAPLEALTEALLGPGVLTTDGGVPAHAFAAAELRRGPLGLLQHTERLLGDVYDIDLWVAHAIGVLDALGSGHTDLVGNSFGGAIALALATRHGCVAWC